MPFERLRRDENRQEGACQWALAGVESVQHSLEEGFGGGGDEALEGLAGWVRVRDRRKRGWGVSSGRSARGGKVCPTSYQLLRGTVVYRDRDGVHFLPRRLYLTRNEPRVTPEEMSKAPQGRVSPFGREQCPLATCSGGLYTKPRLFGLTVHRIATLQAGRACVSSRAGERQRAGS